MPLELELLGRRKLTVYFNYQEPSFFETVLPALRDSLPHTVVLNFSFICQQIIHSLTHKRKKASSLFISPDVC